MEKNSTDSLVKYVRHVESLIDRIPSVVKTVSGIVKKATSCIGSIKELGILPKLSINNEGEINVHTEENPIEMYNGVSIDVLKKIAKNITKGLGCYVDSSGFLVFEFESNRGHQIFRSQLKLNKEGKLVRLDGNYPGQVISPADKFVEEVNETVVFTKKQ